MNYQRDRKGAADIAALAGAPSPRRCAVPGCGRQAHGLVTASTRNLALCKPHLQQKRRTGSAFRKSLTKAERKPFDRATGRVLMGLRERPDVQRAAAALDRMLATAGRPETVWRLYGLKPAQRTRIVLARARESGATGWRLLEMGLATLACFAAQHIDWREREYRWAQLAKPVHRCGAGLKVTRADGMLPPKYPRCEGRLQSHLGKMLDDALSAASDKLVPEIVAVAAGANGRGRLAGTGREADPSTPNRAQLSLTSPLLVSGGVPYRGRPKVAQVTGSGPTEGEGGEERTFPDQGDHSAAPKGNGDDGLVTSHPLPPVLFFDPWTTSTAPTMLPIVQEALRLLSQPAPASPPSAPPLPPEPPADATRDRDAMVLRHGRAKGHRLAALRQQMREDAARRAPPPPSRPTRRPTAKAAKDREMIVTPILANFAKLCLTEPEGARLAVPMAHNKLTRYGRPGFGQLPAILRGLTDRGVLTMHPAVFRRRLTTFEPGPVLRAAFRHQGVTLRDISKAPGEEPILLFLRGAKQWGGEPSSKALVDYADNPASERYRREMREIVDFLATAQLALLDREGRPIAQPPPFLRRHFLTDNPDGPHAFNLGGRLFGGWWQNLKGSERHRLRTDGEGVADLDYVACHLHILYREAGATPPAGDPYAIPGLEAHRQGVKKAFSAIVSARGPLQRLPTDIKVLLPPDWTAARITSALADLHPPLAHLFGTDLGVRLMHTESNLLVAVLLRLIRDHGCPALPMHDGVMVPRSAREIAKAVMESESERLLGVRLPVEEKPVVEPPASSPAPANPAMRSGQPPARGGDGDGGCDQSPIPNPIR